MPITNSAGVDLDALPIHDTWGEWRFQACGLKHRSMDYLIEWKRITRHSDLLFWIMHIATKNRDLYGENTVTHLVDAFREVFGVYSSLRLAQPLDGKAMARAYWERLKQQRPTP